MTAISRATLRSTIRSRGDYTNTRAFPDAYLNTEIQNAFDCFWRIVEESRQGWWDTSATAATIPMTSYLSLPADAKIVKAVDIIIGGEPEELRLVTIGHRNRYGATPDQPRGYRLSARGIELYPTPNAAYTLRVIYSPKPPALDEDTAREWYDGWSDFVIEKVLFALDERERKPLSDRMVALQAAEAVLRSSAGDRRQQEPEYLVLRECDPDDLWNDETRR